jgi:ABC-type molybdenum transport system ATPase subunit/photorepair protein PhrA
VSPKVRALGSQGRIREVIEIKEEDDHKLSPDHHISTNRGCATGRSRRSRRDEDLQPADKDVNIPGPDLVAEHAIPLEDLDEDQQKVITLAVEGHQNLVVIGSAGTGKSTVIAQLSIKLREDGQKVAIVAPSGRTAFIINGQIMHAYGSLGFQMNESLETYKKKAS